MTKIIRFEAGDTLIMKKPHPCGNGQSDAKSFLVLRSGTDVLVKCNACGREMNVHRLKIEPSIKAVIKKD